MVLDILFGVAMLLAIFKGWSKGFIVGLCSFIGLILGAAAALKLSAGFSLYLQKQLNQPSPLWPVVAFVLIFLVVVLIVRLIAGLLEKALKLAMLGWFNRLAGILFYGLAYAVLFSIGLWLVDQLALISPEMKTASRVYPLIAPLSLQVIASLGDFIPWFKDIFHQMGEFFGNLAPLIQ